MEKLTLWKKEINKDYLGSWDLCIGADNKEEATKYSSCVGNRIQEIIDVVSFGYENINEIKIIREDR